MKHVLITVLAFVSSAACQTAIAALTTPAELELYRRSSIPASASAVRFYSDTIMRAGPVSEIETKLIEAYPDKTRCKATLRTNDGSLAEVSVAEGYKVMSRNPLMRYAGRSYLRNQRLNVARVGVADEVIVDADSFYMLRALPKDIDTRLRGVFHSMATRLHTDRKPIPTSAKKLVLLVGVDDDNGAVLAKDLSYSLHLAEVEMTNMAFKEIHTPIVEATGPYGHRYKTNETLYDTKLEGDMKVHTLFEAADFRFNCDGLMSESELNNLVAPGFERVAR